MKILQLSYILFIFALKINHYQQTIIMKQEEIKKQEELNDEQIDNVAGGLPLTGPASKWREILISKK